MADRDPVGMSPLQQMVASGTGAVITALIITPPGCGKGQPAVSAPLSDSLRTPEPLLCHIALLSPAHREVPPVLQWWPGTPGPVPAGALCFRAPLA